MTQPHSSSSLTEAEQTVAPIRELLKAGFPVLHIREMALRHLRDLQALDESVPDRAQAIAATQHFLTSLKDHGHDR